MNVVIREDYDLGLRMFLADLRELGSDIVSVILYGSVARDDIVPGESDLLNAQVFLRDEVFEGKERFIRVLAVMVESCRRISQIGVPFQPYHYFSLSEADLSPAVYLPTWQSDESSKVVMGKDIRAQISSSETSHSVAATSFFGARRTMVHPLAAYLNKQQWTPDDRRKIIEALASVKKHIPVMACFALGVPAEGSRAVEELERLLPGIDASVLKRIDSFRNHTDLGRELGNLREILREVLVLVEHIHDQIAAACGAVLSSKG